MGPRNEVEESGSGEAMLGNPLSHLPFGPIALQPRRAEPATPTLENWSPQRTASCSEGASRTQVGGPAANARCHLH